MNPLHDKVREALVTEIAESIDLLEDSNLAKARLCTLKQRLPRCLADEIVSSYIDLQKSRLAVQGIDLEVMA